MSEKLVEKIIGNSYVVHNDSFFIADVYEGNYYKLLEGGVVKTVMLPKKEYDRVVAQYQERVKNDEMIVSAYELNKKAGLLDKVNDITADPEAAEKEWFLRKHPQVVVETEQKKKGLFGKRRKKALKIKCLECGTINPEGHKFCSECGMALLSAEEEVKAEAVLEKVAENTAKTGDEAEESEIEIINIDEADDKEPDNEDAGLINDVKVVDEKGASDDKVQENETKKNRKPGKKGRVVLILLLFLFIIAAAGGFLFFYFGGESELIFDSTNLAEKTVVEEAANEEDAQVTSYVVIRTKSHIAQNTLIKEDHLEGTILSKEQYEKYNTLSTYIDKDGKSKTETLLLWENKDSVIGKYATKELTPGSILYDTSITTEHVVADKTYVDVEVDGEKKTYETKTDVMPGNTKIQIVALIQTDGEEATSVLLSELTLQDRSLESIFDSAGQDILEMLSTTEDKDQPEDSKIGAEPTDDTLAEESEGQ